MDVDIFEPQSEDYVELLRPDDIQVGDFLIAKFKGGLRNSVNYKYVVQVTQIVENDIEVMGLRSDMDKKTFKKKDSNICFDSEDIIAKLPPPNCILFRNRKIYV
ncbi:unnamed protein product [Psylliodes chrysocephalus]|uniref:Uncharacterized protein n=1 Tax=Psylliodes chrysocephalus TaxID=3402493 RepID=A0A9P0DAA6_9CUCU|nr:unnamed protein product [Psylliodes chrysocephala]